MCAEVSSCGKTCEGESDHQWLGVSLSRQPGEEGGRVLVMHSKVFYFLSAAAFLLFILSKIIVIFILSDPKFISFCVSYKSLMAS